MTEKDFRKYFSKSDGGRVGGIFLIVIGGIVGAYGLIGIVLSLIRILRYSHYARYKIIPEFLYYTIHFNQFGGIIPLALGGLMLGFGIYIVHKSKSCVSDSAVDEYCNSLASAYHTKTLYFMRSQGLQIADEFYFSGYSFDNLFSARLSRTGKDGVWRTSILGLACVFFVGDSVYCYTKSLSLITDEMLEKPGKFKICDIQSASVEQYNGCCAVALYVTGEKFRLSCPNAQAASELCARIETKRA